MGTVRWDFPLLGSGKEQGYTNSGIETFTGKGLFENLAREICQNSLDAKDISSTEPVKVKFELMLINRNEHSIFSEYRECINCCRENWGLRMDDRLHEFLLGAEKTLDTENIHVLVASDYNTTGLEGVNASEDEKSAWMALAHSDGTSVKESNDSAGSFGIGKNAPFACSTLSMVFYNTYAIDEGRAFQGTARLATMKRNGKRTVGTGHYLYIDNDEDWRPIKKEDNCSFQGKFSRDTYGTDIIIVGFEETDDWADRMVRAIISNFFLAIKENKLVVDVQGRKISSLSLSGIINEFKDDARVETRVIYEWYQALTAPDDKPLLLTIKEENDVELYIKTNDDFHNRVAAFRSSGMRIKVFHPLSFQHFAAVIVIRNEELNKLLRKAEPVRHDNWDYRLIKDKVISADARKALEMLSSWIREVLKKKYEAIGVKTQDSGEGAYLPDDVDASENDQSGEDILRVRQKISKTHIDVRNPGHKQTNMEPEKDTGIFRDDNGKEPIEDAGDNTDVSTPRRRKGTVIDKKIDDAPEMGHSHTGEHSSIVDITAQKAFIIRQEIGLYKIIIRTTEDNQNVFLTFFAIGEDDEEDDLLVEKYTCDGATHIANGKSIGPIVFQKDVVKEIFVYFKIKEKMRINIVAKGMK